MSLKKRAVRKSLRAIVFTAALLSIFGMGAVSFLSQDAKLQELNKDIQSLEDQKKEALMQVEGSKRMLEYSRSDDYIEQLARGMLGWVYPGEILYKQADPDAVLPEQVQ